MQGLRNLLLGSDTLQGTVFRPYIEELFAQDFRTPMPSHIHVSLLKQPAAIWGYRLAYPYWMHACKDGSRDKRYGENMLIRPQSVLVVGRWQMECVDPIAMNDFIIGLWQNGHAIPLCDEEQQKYLAVREDLAEEFRGTSVTQLYRRFTNDSSGFEEWCASLFRKVGMQVRVTPPVNDGGYDLDILNGRVRMIAECKCYHPSKGTVGRPLLQKLVGANAHEHAQQMLFMTTGKYSSHAVEYAREQGIRLMDGEQLVKMDVTVRAARQTPRTMRFGEWFLTREDILSHCPPDMT